MFHSDPCSFLVGPLSYTKNCNSIMVFYLVYFYRHNCLCRQNLDAVPVLCLGGLSGIGLGLGPGGQPIDATQLNRGGGGMGNMGPGGNWL